MIIDARCSPQFGSCRAQTEELRVCHRGFRSGAQVCLLQILKILYIFEKYFLRMIKEDINHQDIIKVAGLLQFVLFHFITDIRCSRSPSGRPFVAP